VSPTRTKIEDRLRESASRAAAPTAPLDTTPPSLRLEPGGRAPRAVGERRPDETGMLRMVPLAHVDAPVEDVNATAFFQVPVPNRARGPVAPMPSVAPAQLRPAFPEPLRAAPFASSAITPVILPAHTPPPSDGARIQSMRVLAALSLVFLLLGAAALLAAVALVVVPRAPVPPLPEAPPTPVVTAWQADPEPEDTAAPDATAEVPVRAPSAPRVKDLAPRAPKPPPVHTVTARFSGDPLPTRVEVTCPGIARQRVDVVNGVATLPSLPAGVECWMHPKGGVVTTAAKIEAGRDYTCTLTSTTTSCR
jgi:hypothetical protein